MLLALLPIYILGNLHCMGMCGPLVMMLGRHRYKYFYFAGRTLSFALAGLAAGGMGSVLNVALQEYHMTALISFLFGSVIMATLLPFPVPAWVTERAAGANRTLSILMLKDEPLATFLFGFFTIALPCGQTIVVYSACAISGDPWVGLFNGFLFALFTSPSLFFAMHAHKFLRMTNKYYELLILFVGVLAMCRGFAELGWIPHLVLNAQYHIVLY